MIELSKLCKVWRKNIRGKLPFCSRTLELKVAWYGKIA